MTTLDPATWRALDDEGNAELRVNGKRITSFPSYSAAEEAANRINAALSSIPAQPVGAITWADIRENFGSTDLSIFDLLAAVNDIIAKRAPSHPAAVAVTDEMVERACRQEFDNWDKYVADPEHMRWAEDYRSAMRRTLEAALVDRVKP